MNHNKRETSWQDPRYAAKWEEDVKEKGGPPKGWEIMWTKKGLQCFVNHNERKTAWDDLRGEV